MIFVLVYLDWKLFLLLLFSIPVLYLSLTFFGKIRERYSRRLQETIGKYTQFMSQLIQGIEVVKLFNSSFLKKEFESINKSVFKNQVKSILNDVFYLSSIEIVSYLTISVIIGFGGYRIIKGDLTTGEFFAFLGALLILVNSSQIMQRGLIQLKIVKPVIDRIQYLLNLPEEKKEGILFNGLKEKIEYKNVSLKIGENQILKDINLKINKGEKVGIVGLTGSGKSTLVKLIPALIKDFEGKLLIDNYDVREYNVSSLRKYIGYVSQEVFIFNDTLRNNLLIAKPDATDEELIHALKKAKADFAFNLENGLDTVLGEKGSRLSGGERQRISIARLFLKNPDIIIIDEGTSALDVETEEYVMEEIKKEFNDKTVVMITHRLKVLDIAEKIVVMENGQIVEQGTKEQLLLKKGVFYKFSSLSSK
jgi:subfamily B ATP-binding cassette protein MsbA